MCMFTSGLSKSYDLCQCPLTCTALTFSDSSFQKTSLQSLVEVESERTRFVVSNSTLIDLKRFSLSGLFTFWQVLLILRVVINSDVWFFFNGRAGGGEGVFCDTFGENLLMLFCVAFAGCWN